MNHYYAKILPNKYVATNIGETVPLIVEHNIYDWSIGEVKILSENYAEIITDDERVSVGGKLSAGAFLTAGTTNHHIREVSIVEHPRFEDCEILQEMDKYKLSEYSDNL